jgi:WD40-like Beta Propeller Repeat
LADGGFGEFLQEGEKDAVGPAEAHDVGVVTDFNLSLIGTGQVRTLLDPQTIGDVLRDPAFSPDGSQVLFSSTQGTYYYPTDIYAVKVDGSGLTKLTRSKQIDPDHRPKGIGNAEYWQYFYSARFAPDGSKILVEVYDTISDHFETGL